MQNFAWGQTADPHAKDKNNAEQRKAADALKQSADKALAKEKAPSLEELLAESLKNNPDIRVAESKLRESEAELNRVRLLVTQKVVGVYQEIAAQKARTVSAEQAFRRTNLSIEQLNAAEADLQKAKADLMRAEAEMPYLLGSSTQMRVRTVFFAPDFIDALRFDRADLRKPPGAGKPAEDTMAERKELWTRRELVTVRPKGIPQPMVDKLRKALDTPIQVNFQEIPMKDVFEFLQPHVKGFNIVPLVQHEHHRLNFNLKEAIPVGAVFQYLEDQYGWRFVVRDYGIVIADVERLPPGAVNLLDLWKNRPADATQK